MSISGYCSREIGRHWSQWWQLQWLTTVFCGSHTSRQHQHGVFRRQGLRGQAAATAKHSVCSGIIVQSLFLENNRDIICIIQGFQRNGTTIYMYTYLSLYIFLYKRLIQLWRLRSLFRPLVDWVMPTHIGEGQVHQFKC